CLHQGDDAAARSHLEQCLAIAREIRHQEVEGECELVLGKVAFEMADPAQASLGFKRSLTVCREAGDKRGEANALRWLARVDLHAGDLASARARLSDALRSFRTFEMREELLGCLEDHAELAQAEGKVVIAVGLAASAAKSRERLGLTRSPRGELCWQALIGRSRRTMIEAPFDSAWDEAQQWQIDEAIRHALSSQIERATAETEVPVSAERVSRCRTCTWLESRVPGSVYSWICWISSSARCCLGLGEVRTSKVGASGLAWGMRQALRTMVASSSSRVRKLCAGVPSSSVWLATLASAALERLAGATGSRVALACWSQSANISSRQASRMCHST